jgi:hypothetical protein
MTDLERLWEDYPVGPAPTADILREGRRRVTARRRRAITRPLLATGTALALGAAFLTGTLVHRDAGGSGGAGAATGAQHAGPAVPSPVAFQADLPAATSCGQLLSSYVDRGLARVSAWGWQGGMLSGLFDDQGAVPLASGSLGSMDAFAAAPMTTRQISSATGTNVQEAGVDEPDTVKTDGHLLVRVQGGDLLVYDVSGAAPVQLASLALARVSDPELLLAGTTVVVLGTDSTAPAGTDGHGTAGTRVLTVSLADPAHPTIAHDVAYSASLLSARQHGDVVRLVLSSGLPDLGFVHPTGHRTAKEALAANRALVQHSTLADWLPTYDAGSGSGQLLDCHDVAIPPMDLGLDTVSVVGFTAEEPTEPTAIGLAGATTVAYESADDLYLTGVPQTATPCPGCMQPLAGPVPGPMAVPGGKTYVFDFALFGDTAIHVATGTVDGTIADRWSMDSVDGSLRIAVGPSSTTADANAILTFRRKGTHLVESGRLGGLGRHEQIQAVRWFDGLAILVTYRQTDPMYAVDLTDPTHPRLLGALELPGFSSYLHPLGGKRMIGVGAVTAHERTTAQIGLFDVSDLRHVRRLDVHAFGTGTTAVAEDDARAFTWLPAYRTVLTVIRHGRAGYLAILKLHGGKLHATTVPVGRGSDVDQARTIGLPDGRVLLVTASGVRFLTL